MKELTIVEKAKRYESALERCRKLYNEAKANEYTSDIEDYETIFPELKESEDEKIRKELISLVENWKIFNPNSPFDEHPVYTSDKDTVDKILAWLKKQGEKKSQRMISAEAKEAMYDKPAWSEEDEEMFDAIIADIQFTQKAHTHDDNQAVYEREIDWLKSLKQRIGG